MQAVKNLLGVPPLRVKRFLYKGSSGLIRSYFFIDKSLRLLYNLKMKFNFISEYHMKKGIYKTRQRSLIEEYLKKCRSHITVDEMYLKLKSDGVNIGRTTVYRCLEKLADEGKARKYVPQDGRSVCYQYVEHSESCTEHFHLKCETCGALIHMDCRLMDELYGHIESEHGFHINRLKTVIYGVCEKCSQNQL